MQFLLAYLVIINALAFLFMLIDKRKAQKNLWRIPERILLTIALCGGSLGIVLGMRVARHKTKHLKFSLCVPILLAIQIIFCILLYMCI